MKKNHESHLRLVFHAWNLPMSVCKDKTIKRRLSQRREIPDDTANARAQMSMLSALRVSRDHGFHSVFGDSEPRLRKTEHNRMDHREDPHAYGRVGEAKLFWPAGESSSRRTRLLLTVADCAVKDCQQQYCCDAPPSSPATVPHPSREYYELKPGLNAANKCHDE